MCCFPTRTNLSILPCSNSSIEFKNVSAKYREGLPLVLKDLSFSIEAGQKVGIVGRTGAGKSSVTLTLFRIIELDQGKLFCL